MNQLYLRIKQLADEHHVSIRQLEKDLGFGNGVINRWKKNTPGIDKVQAVADYFDVTTDYLLGRTDTPQFNRRDELDVQKTLNELIEGLSDKNALSYMKNGMLKLVQKTLNYYVLH